MIPMSVISTSLELPSNEAYVADTSLVNPVRVVYVVPEAIAVLPRVGAEYVVAEEIALHALPVHAYMVLSDEFQYVAPVIRALPKLSTVGADDLEPR
jgi:hypothetical protein